MRAAFVLFCLPVVACTTLADLSSGQVGCPPADVQITDERIALSSRTWTAECEGRRFNCTAHGGGEGTTDQVSCAPSSAAAVPGGSDAAPIAGCQNDMQCKGDRVCQQGTCVEPAPASTPTPAQPVTDPFESPPA